MALHVIQLELPPQAGGWSWLGALLLPIVILPSALVIQLARSGQATGLHLPERTVRLGPLALTALTATVTWFAIHQLGGPDLLLRLSGATALQLGACYLITRAWKVSCHAATTATSSTFLGALHRSLWPLAILAIGAVAWSRLWLGRHTV